MHIDKFEEAMMNCRFCFMCRHLSAVGNVRFTEADTPRIRAAMIYGLRTGTTKLDDPDFIETLYRQDLSACCRFHCVNHYDENGLALAARADVVEAGFAPEAVKKLAKKLAATSSWKASGKGKVALFIDETTASDKAEVAALQKLMKKAAGDYVTVTGGCIGKALKILGFLDDAKAAAAKFADFLNGLGVDEVVCANPAALDALRNDYPEFGVKLAAKPYCTAGYLLEKKVKFAKRFERSENSRSGAKAYAGALYYLADDFMRNYVGCDCPEKLLKALKADEKPFGTNPEETYNCGEGAVVLDKLYPEIVKSLAQYVAARADDPKKDQIVTLGVYAKTQLVKYGKLNVKTLNEIAAACL